MTTKIVRLGDLVTCNTCGKEFEAPKQMTCGVFYGELNESSRCPHCDHTSRHYVHAPGIMPDFEGSYGQKIIARLIWLRDN